MAHPPFVSDASITEWMHDDSTELSPATHKSYAAHLRMLCKYGLPPAYCGRNPIEYCIVHANDTIQRIRTAPLALTSKQALACVVLAIFKHSDDANADEALVASFPVWVAYAEEVEAQVKSAALTNAPSAREAAAWVSVHEARAKERALAATEYGSSMHLLLAWHVLWGPFRGGDSGLVYIVGPADARATDPQGPNVLVLDASSSPTPSATVIVRQHKTAHQLGAIVRPLPPALLAIVLRSLELEPRETLFASPATGAPFNSEASYNAWANRQFSRLFGRPATANTFRHAFITALYNESIARTSQQQLAEVASSMGHSLFRQALYRRVEASPSTLVGTASEPSARAPSAVRTSSECN